MALHRARVELRQRISDLPPAQGDRRAHLSELLYRLHRQWSQHVRGPGSARAREMPYFDMGNTFDYAEMAYLMVPRPFMVERGHHDRVGQDQWVAHEYAKVRW